MAKHDYKTAKDCKCDNPYCNVCEGGLEICKVCGLYEGSLTTDCPGERVDGDSADKVYQGKMDYRNGEWVQGVTIHMRHVYGE